MTHRWNNTITYDVPGFQNLPEFLPEAVQFFQRMERLNGEEREQQFGAYRHKSRLGWKCLGAR